MLVSWLLATSVIILLLAELKLRSIMEDVGLAGGTRLGDWTEHQLWLLGGLLASWFVAVLDVRTLELVLVYSSPI